MQPSRSLDKAREAYENRDLEGTRAAHGNVTHSHQAFDTYNSQGNTVSQNEGLLPKHNEEHFEGAEFIKSAMYGGFDGILTTFALVMSLIGGSDSESVTNQNSALKIMSLGVANLIADGMSMGIADYFSSKSEQELAAKEKEREQWEVENNLEGEKQEMYEIYVEKGMDKDDARLMTDILAKNPKAFVDIMMVEELGMIEDDSNPMYNGLVTFASFAVFGLIPILPYVYGAIKGEKDGKKPYLYIPTLCLTGVTLFLLGVGKSRYASMTWWGSGIQTLVIGGVAAASAFAINYGFN